LNKGYDKCAQGFSQLLIKIAIDEMVIHTTTGSTVLNRLANSPEFKNEFQSGWFKEMATDYLKQVAEKEVRWSNYLLESGDEPGFNQAINTHFIQYWTDRRLKELNLEPVYNVKKNDVEIWFDDYRNVKDKQSALQEISNVSYQLGQTINDLYKFDERN
jgi:ribonucleoside-diphosphate reductase beta chain